MTYERIIFLMCSVSNSIFDFFLLCHPFQDDPYLILLASPYLTVFLYITVLSFTEIRFMRTVNFVDYRYRTLMNLKWGLCQA